MGNTAKKKRESENIYLYGEMVPDLVSLLKGTVIYHPSRHKTFDIENMELDIMSLFYLDLNDAQVMTKKCQSDKMQYIHIFRLSNNLKNLKTIGSSSVKHNDTKRLRYDMCNNNYHGYAVINQRRERMKKQRGGKKGNLIYVSPEDYHIAIMLCDHKTHMTYERTEMCIDYNKYVRYKID